MSKFEFLVELNMALLLVIPSVAQITQIQTVSDSESCIAPMQYKFTFVNRNVVIIHCFAQACSLVIDSLGLTVQVVVASCTQ